MADRTTRERQARDAADRLPGELAAVRARLAEAEANFRLIGLVPADPPAASPGAAAPDGDAAGSDAEHFG